MKTVYFDNAATTFPKPEIVYTQMDEYYRNCGVNVGRGQYKIASKANALVEETRDLLKEVLNCKNKDIVFMSSATEALNLTIQGAYIKTNSNVYVTPFEHNAVTRVLHQIKKTVGINIIELKVDKLLMEYDILGIESQFKENRPDAIIMSHASNVCGIIAPIKEIAKRGKKFNSYVIIDAAQTAGLVEEDFGIDYYDAVIFAGHKTLYGPFGIGGIALKKGLKLMPMMFGGTGLNSMEQDLIEDVPERYEVGSKNILSISGLNASLKWLLNKNIKCIYDNEKSKYEKLKEVLSKYENIKLIGCSDQTVGVISLVFEGYSPDEIGRVFDANNIAVRTGLHCSPFAHRFLGTYPAGTVRISLNYFNTDGDFEKLEKLLDYIEENS